ncbi:sugar phosphate isomerase/epimerase family protein [Candidatus Contubernalis alkaliaceticus]|uniref:sugar phosphate isomerase/epimerase family protein n=1 Tax=Candidatus Contubernalis alkaliaceticus TaxID=338645 RepID=UPI001F4C5257|nr:sugar phosphate isomerase/epimerase family protein [Candidatus Contubernalis alkalaceticus]UNC91021.1 sugar phosphate isomerase/epimerase [Candidatus Contubernalis alkalaceticus]
MKFGFSTIGCPGWSWSEIITTASDLGYDGVELRGIGSEMYLPRVKEFSLEKIPALCAKMQELKLQIPCLTTNAFLFDSEKLEIARQEVVDYLNLASALATPYIRVLGDANPQPGTVDQALVEENLLFLLPLAAEKNVTLLLETNGVYASSAKMKALLEKINHPNLGVLWDIHHPYRFHGEPIAQTYNELKPWIKHVHMKDSVRTSSSVEYRMLTCGDIPAAEVVSLLFADNYLGYLVLEWVKRWNSDLEEPGIVFPHYINTIKKLLPEKTN